MSGLALALSVYVVGAALTGFWFARWLDVRRYSDGQMLVLVEAFWPLWWVVVVVGGIGWHAHKLWRRWASPREQTVESFVGVDGTVYGSAEERRFAEQRRIEDYERMKAREPREQT